MEDLATYAATRRETPQARVFAHDEPHETSLTVVVGDTPIAVISDGDFVTYADPSHGSALVNAAREFAQAAIELSQLADDAGVPDPFGVPAGG